MTFVQGEEEEKKKRKKKKKKEVTSVPAAAEENTGLVTQPSEQKRKCPSAEFEVEVSAAQKTEKKRRRSQTAEGTESEMPSKIRKKEEGGGEEVEKDVTVGSKSSQ